MLCSARYLALAHVLTPFASLTSLIRSTAATWPVRNQANFKQQIILFTFGLRNFDSLQFFGIFDHGKTQLAAAEWILYKKESTAAHFML
jgi:hypothetical protein